jgi:hypothetical protein
MTAIEDTVVRLIDSKGMEHTVKLQDWYSSRGRGKGHSRQESLMWFLGRSG